LRFSLLTEGGCTRQSSLPIRPAPPVTDTVRFPNPRSIPDFDTVETISMVRVGWGLCRQLDVEVSDGAGVMCVVI